MTRVITHTKVTSGTVDNDVEVDLSDWNDTHTQSGTWDPADGGTGTSTPFTQGAVVFAGASGIYSQATEFSWDDTLKKLNLNLSGGTLAAAETSTGFQMDGADGFATTIFMDSHGATAAIDFRQQGGTKAAPTATAAGATMGQINFQGWDGTAYGKNARLRAVAEASGANWTLTDHGVGLAIFTTAPGTTSLTEKFHVYGNGGATIGSALTNNGAGTLNLAALYSNNTLIIDSSGNVTTPSVNKVAITAPATAATLTIANNKTLTASNTLTLTATDGSTAAFGAGGTVAYKGLSLAQFAATTSAELRTLLSDESGSGAAYFQGGDLGTPSAGVLTNATGLPLAGVTGTWTIARGGTGQTTQQAAFDALAPTATRAGDVTYWNGTHYVNLAGNNSGTKVLQEDASGVPSWGTAGAGDLVGPASATDNALVRFDATTGKLVQNSEITLGDSDGKLTRTAGISVAGTNTNDNAAAGYIGEVIESEVLSASAVSVTNGTAADITSISLTAGDWDVWGLVCSVLAGGSSTTAVWGWINTVSATSPTAPGKGAFARQPCAAIVDNFQLPVGMRRISISGTTTVYLGGLVNFTIGTMKMFGYIGARRAR